MSETMIPPGATVLTATTPVETEESWTNHAVGRVWITLPDGREKVTRAIHGGRTFYILPSDRRRFSASVADPLKDPFRNGTFGMNGDLTVFGSERERQELLSSPNTLTPDQMVELAKADAPTFEERLASITNPVTVKALLDASVSVEASAARTTAIEARLNALRPIVAQEGDPDLDDGTDEEPARRTRPIRSSASVG